jgi:Xaa-Pro aminopeptidase
MIERGEALRRVDEALTGNRLDALVATAPWNVCYTAGTSFSTQKTIPERLAFTISTPDGAQTFIYCAIEDGHARDESWIEDRRGYVEFAERPTALLAEVLRERGVDRGRVGVEKRFLAAQYVEELLELLPDVELVAADTIFDAMRAVKTPAEIEILARAAVATDAAIAEAFLAARPGDSEASVASRMISACRERGGESLLHMVLATGSNMLKAHHAPDGTPLEPGGVVRTDFGMTWGHYLSDIARTAFVAPADPGNLAIYRRLEEAHQETIAAIAPGVRVGDVFDACKRAFEAHGLDFRMPHVGHSIGLGLHEHPMIHPGNDESLKPEMVLMIEPVAFTAENFFHTEDMVVVTDAGRKIMSRSRDWAEPLVIG